MLTAVLAFTVATTAPETATTLEYSAAATGTVVLATGVSLALGILVHSVPYTVSGRPSPWVTSGGFAVALGLNAGLTHLALPWLAHALGRGDSLAERQAVAWSSSRWALAAGGVGLLTFVTGAALEESAFGRGQAVMAVGALLSVLSLLVWDVAEAVASWVAR